MEQMPANIATISLRSIDADNNETLIPADGDFLQQRKMLISLSCRSVLRFWNPSCDVIRKVQNAGCTLANLST